MREEERGRREGIVREGGGIGRKGGIRREEG